MMTVAAGSGDLDSAFGSANVAKLASAYGNALRELTGGTLSHHVERDVRIAIVRCLVEEARRGVFDADVLTSRALAAVGRREGESAGFYTDDCWRI